jgi:ABC-type methionine transport system ATPase subunit
MAAPKRTSKQSSAPRKRVARFHLDFPQRVIDQPVMHGLSRRIDVVHNILRGRITDKSAWLEIELVGRAGDIRRAVAYLKARGIRVESLGVS